MSTFDSAKLRTLLASLDQATLDSIKAKARHEQVTIGAVLRDYYPDLWAQINNV
jgi:hypothetical protein